MSNLNQIVDQLKVQTGFNNIKAVDETIIFTMELSDMKKIKGFVNNAESDETDITVYLDNPLVDNIQTLFKVTDLSIQTEWDYYIYNKKVKRLTPGPAYIIHIKKDNWLGFKFIPDGVADSQYFYDLSMKYTSSEPYNSEYTKYNFETGTEVIIYGDDQDPLDGINWIERDAVYLQRTKGFYILHNETKLPITGSTPYVESERLETLYNASNPTESRPMYLEGDKVNTTDGIVKEWVDSNNNRTNNITKYGYKYNDNWAKFNNPKVADVMNTLLDKFNPYHCNRFWKDKRDEYIAISEISSII